jgi:hypothetical protein
METILVNYVAAPGEPFAYPITPRTPLQDDYWRTLNGQLSLDSYPASPGPVITAQEMALAETWINQLALVSVGHTLALMLKGEPLGIVLPERTVRLICEALRKRVAKTPPRPECKPGEPAA